MQQQSNNWKPAKILYLILAVMLSCSVIPLAPYFINVVMAEGENFNYIGFLFDISALIIAITVLFRAKMDGKNRAGAIFGMVTYILAFVCDVCFFIYANQSHLVSSSGGDFMFGFVTVFSVITWIINVVAVIFCYMNTFQEELPSMQTTYVPNQAGVNNPTVNEQASVSIGYSVTAQPQYEAKQPVQLVEDSVSFKASGEIMSNGRVIAEEKVNVAGASQTAKKETTQAVKTEQQTNYVTQLTNDLLTDTASVITKDDTSVAPVSTVENNDEKVVITADMLDDE